MASDVAALVAEMSGTLSSIRQAIDALSSAAYDSRLDDLEHQRDSAIAALRANFERETDDLGSKRRHEREEVAERRRREDEEIRERRRREDEEMKARDKDEDQKRDERMLEEVDGVEDEMDGLMDAVETEADASLAEGRDRLAKLEERRKELNRLIDEKIQVPFPTVRTRRRSRNRRAMAAAITSKQATPEEPLSNTTHVTDEACDDRGPMVMARPRQQAEPGGSDFSSDVREGGREEDGPVSTSTGLWEPGQSARSLVDSGSLAQPGGIRTSGFGWISGNIGSSEGRGVSAAPAVEPPSESTLPNDSSGVPPNIPGRSPSRGSEVDLTEETPMDVVEPVVGDAGPPGLAQAVESVSSDIPLLSEVATHDDGSLQLPTSPEHSTSGHETDDRYEAGEGYDLTPASVEATEVAMNEGGTSPTESTVGRDSPVFQDYESHHVDPDNGSSGSLQYISEDQAPDQIQTLPLKSLAPEVTFAPVLDEVMVSDSARSGIGDESTRESSPPARGVQDDMSISSCDDEMDAPEDSFHSSPPISPLQSPAGALELTTDTLAHDMNFTSGADVHKYLDVPVELPLHAMDYCAVLESVQLPDGTWSTGMIEPELYQALVAQFLIPAPRSLQVDAQDLPSMSPAPVEEEAGSLCTSDASTSDVDPHSQGTSNNNIRSLISAGFSNELHPVVMQLADRTWFVDPSREEFDAAVVSSRGSNSTPTLEMHSASAVDSADDESVGTKAALDAGWMDMGPQPVVMQLPSSEWVIDSDEEYKAAASQQHNGPAGIDHVTAVATEPQWTPMSDASQKHQLGKPEPNSPMPVGMDQSQAGPAWWESSQAFNHISLEQNVSASGSETSSDGENPNQLNTECELGGGKPGAEDRIESSGQFGPEPVDTGSLPWSPFNSRYPLYPASPSPLNSVHSRLGTPDNLFAQADTLNITASAADTESQSFVTPLQSAGLSDPPRFQDKQDLLFQNAVDYTTQSTGSPDENATTVHGHDELFDSEDESDPEPNPDVGEDEGPRTSPDMPQQHSSAIERRQVDYATAAPTIPVLQAAPEFSTPQSVQHSPGEDISEDLECDVDANSQSPQEPEPAAASRGLAFSRHNPGRPATPPSKTIPDYSESDRESWDASEHIDSTPMSLVSHSTLSSPGSPVVLRGLDHEIEMQGSWSGHIHHLSLSGHDHIGHSRMGEDYGSADSDYDPSFANGLKISEEDLPTPIAAQFPAHDTARQHSPANPSPSTLIQKMRSVFESQNSTYSSLPSSRPVSGVLGAPLRPESPGYDVPGEVRKGGFLGEAEDEADERSALLGMGSR